MRYILGSNQRFVYVSKLTVLGYPEQEKLLEAIVVSECFKADELPEVSENEMKELRKPPTGADLLDDLDDS